MDSKKLKMRTAGRLALSTVVFFLVSSVAMTSITAEAAGYVSPNPNDLPPDMDRDPGPKSSDPNLPPAYGPEEPKVLVVIFADYQCPACKRASQSTHQIAAEFPDEVRMEFWNNPIPSHRNADLAAAAGIAAQQQGMFWEMHDMLFANGKQDPATLEENAQKLGLDVDQFRSDMNSPATQERLQKEIETANALGATNTPSYLVNGKVYMGWGSWRSLRGKIDRELKKANALADEGMNSAEILNQRALENHLDSESYEVYRAAVLELDNS